MNITDQGLVQVRIHDLLKLRISHFYSAADAECAPEVHVRRCGSVTTMSGFTEWIGPSLASASIGWDWLISVHPHTVQWQRVNLPRTNIQLLNLQGVPLSWAENLHVLATWVDAQCWIDSVAQNISCTTPST
ncbi:DUF4902 domain-containing protein [Limnohabitans sp.]|uniref:DUF4902 domain-containing protein n=1 Tax=Limnohabitans sp. TaxID=1907725 RepID=UPI00311ED8FD